MAECENILVCIGLQNKDYGCSQNREILQLQVSITFTEHSDGDAGGGAECALWVK